MINKKNRDYIFAVILFVLFFSQITFFSQLFPTNYVPNIILIALIAFSVVDRSENILYFTFIIGIILDVISSSYFGLIVISMLVAIFVTSYLGIAILKNIFSYQLLIISFVGIFVYNILYIMLINISNLKLLIFNVEYIMFIILFQIIVSLIFIYPITRLFSYSNEK